MTGDHQPPQNIEAEQAVLGGCLLSGAALREVRRVISDDDWYRPAHSMIWQAILEVAARPGVQADAVTVAAELVRRGQIGKVGGHPYLHTLISGVPTAANAGYYAELVAEQAVFRRLAEAGARIQQMAMGAANGADMEGVLADVLERARAEMLTVRPVDRDGDRPEVGIIDMLDEKLPDRPLIPGLLDEQERLIFTGGEGLGKSTVLRQLVVCASAGLHPFRHTPIEPISCVVFDYENPKKLNQRRYGPLISAALEESEATEADLNRRLHIIREPRGVNLLSRAQADRVLRTVDRLRPQLVLIGPIYRLYNANPNDEEKARQLADVLDAIRDAAEGCAMATEHHAAKSREGGKRSLEPLGTSLWLRWPEFGYGIALSEGSDLAARAVDFVPWRGPRDERDWPENMISGYAIGDPWPWRQVDRRTLVAPPEPPDEPDWG